VLLAMSDVVLVSMERWLEQLGGRVARRARRIAIASNLPDRRGERDAARRRLGADDDAVVLVSFGTDHPSRQPARIAALANAASAAGLDVLVVNLGAGAPALPGLGDDVPIVTPGPLARDELAAHMAAGDLYLAPFVDGVSSRRTTMAAALQHALPVLGTRGVSTDAFLAGREPALTLVEVDDADGFVAAGLRLLGNRELRERGRTAARELYERELDWAAARERWRDVVAALGR
jgi:glycosyltransferase involved in cell wall biosynthesis